MQAKVKRGTAQQWSVELEITLPLLDAICWFLLFFFLISVYLFVFNRNGNRSYLLWTAVRWVPGTARGALAKEGSAARACAGRSQHLTGAWEKHLVQSSSSGHSGVTYKNTLKLFCALPFSFRYCTCTVCCVLFTSSPLKIQEVSLVVELNSEGLIVGKSWIWVPDRRALKISLHLN